MSEKLKIKIDGTVTAGDIPDDAEDLELECTEVADRAFYNNAALRRLTLVNVERIGERAFNCKELVSVELINCKEIASYAFANNKKLLDLKVTGAEIIGEKAFSTCSYLLSAEFVNCKMSGAFAFKRCGSLTSAKMDCKVINERAFHECGSLKELTLLNTEVIERYAFFNCHIIEIKLPDTIREFRCHSLDSVYIHHWDIGPRTNDVKRVKHKTDGIVSKGDIPDDTEELELECREIADFAFFKNRSLRRVKLINVERIGESAFAHCKNLYFAEIINCKEIAELAFAENGILLELTLNSVDKIDSKAFYCCRKLTGVELTGCVETGASAFEGCKYLARARLDCIEIGDRAFADCDHLTDITFSNTEVIGEYAFSNRNKPREIKLPDTLREIKSGAFDKVSIDSLVIPPNVARLGKSVFDDIGTLEIYQNKDGAFPIAPGCSPFNRSATIVARSAQTDEVLFQFMTPNSDCMVFTERGVDFTEYDKALPRFWMGYSEWSDVHIKAAQMRLRYPAGMSEKTFKYFTDLSSEAAVRGLEKRMRHGYHVSHFEKYPFYDVIKIDAFLDIVLFSANENKKPEITKVLLKALCGRLCDTGGTSGIDGGKLTEITGHSAGLGLTEVTAVLLQKLNELRNAEGFNDPDHEL